MKTTKKQEKAQAQQEAVNTLLDMIKPNDLVYTALKSVSSGGMSRQIAVYLPYVNNEGQSRIKDITYFVGKALDLKVGSKDGLVVGGCGMDMGFNTIYNLGRTLWPNGTQEPHGTRNGVPDSAGGYALKQSWL